MNLTDGSVAVVTAVAADSLTTTRLLGGTDNTWANSDVYIVNPFTVTFAKVDADNNDTQVEVALITSRSTDTLTVPTGGRGYDGSTAQSFDAGDKVQLRVHAVHFEDLKKFVAEIAETTDTNATNISSVTTRVSALEVGSYDYVVSTGSANAYVVATPALAAYAAGNFLEFKASFINTGAATVNVNSLGAKSIKKLDGATALASGDIQSGQIVRLRYDGTNFQMLSPIGQSTSLNYVKVLKSTTNRNNGSIVSDTISNTATLTAFTTTYSAAANLWAAQGDIIRARMSGGNRSKTSTAGTLTIGFYHGTTAICTPISVTMTDNQDYKTWDFDIDIICDTAGASGKLYVVGRWHFENTSTKTGTVNLYDIRDSLGGTTLDLTAAGTISVKVQFGTADTANVADLSVFYLEKRSETPFS